ncbi:MAG: substrate-binding domain-containing protein [Tissierellales bacterium]|jgi:ribose transport system substrate-binding protein|nr:substrate-binding domain-containing protein [Tissierellales bacterium]
MKKTLALLILALVLVVSGCSTGTGGDSDEIVIGASLLTQAHPFQVAIKDAIEAEAANQGATVNVSIADQDLNRQISAIEDFITQEVDAIIIVPVDSDGITGAIKKAQDAGIPVITADIKANGVEVSSHIATDNYSGGLIAAEAMAKYLDGEGNVGLITYPEVQSVRDRIDGFKDNAENHPGLNIVTELPGRTREEAKTASEDMLTANPDLAGIFGFGDDMALAATSAIEERESDAVVIGFDGLEEAQNAVSEDNPFKAVVVQFPDEMGTVAVQNAIKVINGESVDKEVPITPGLFVYGEGFVDVTVEDGIVTIAE